MKSSQLRNRLFAAVVAAFAFQASANAEIIFQDDFEGANLSKRAGGFSWAESKDTSVSNARSKSGSYALKFTYVAKGEGQDGFSEQRFNLGGSYPDIWIKYDLYVPSNYVHREQNDGQENNKGFFYLWSGDYTNPSGPMIGNEFWPNGGSGTTSYGTLRVFSPSTGVDKHVWDAMGKAIEDADRGQWVTITIHVKYASSANNDGIAEVWKTRNGTRTQIMNVRNGNWYKAGSAGFTTGYILGWANSGFSALTEFYVDNFAVANTSLLTDVVTPSAPGNVTVE